MEGTTANCPQSIVLVHSRIPLGKAPLSVVVGRMTPQPTAPLPTIWHSFVADHCPLHPCNVAVNYCRLCPCSVAVCRKKLLPTAPLHLGSALKNTTALCSRLLCQCVKRYHCQLHPCSVTMYCRIPPQPWLLVPISARPHHRRAVGSGILQLSAKQQWAVVPLSVMPRCWGSGWLCPPVHCQIAMVCITPLGPPQQSSLTAVHPTSLNHRLTGGHLIQCDG